MASQDLRGTWEQKETEGKLEPLVPGVKMVLKVQREEAVLLERTVLLVLVGRKENSVFQDYQVTREDKVRRDRSDFPVFQAQMERRAQEEPLANQVQGGNEVQRVHVVKEVQGEQQESQAPRVTLEGMAPLVPLVKGDLPDLKDPLDFQDRRAPLVHQGKTDFPDTPAREVKLVSKERRVPQVLLALLVPRVQLERLVQWVKEAIQDLLVPLASRDYLVWREKKDQRETLAQQVYQAKMDPQV